LRDAANAALGVSPLSLTHVANGLYSANFTMPSTGKVTAVTSVYTDAGFTTLNTDYTPAVDEFVALQTSLIVNNYGPTDLVGEISCDNGLAGTLENC
jgi:hypothetical protein